MLSSSMPIRARGLMGLLNLFHNDTAQETRLCNPQYILFLGRIVTPDRLVSMLEPPPFFLRCINRIYNLEEPTNDSFAERYHNPATTTVHDGSIFNAYETALRVVDFEINGPQNNDESFTWPRPRLLGAAGISPDVWDDMEAALRFHEKHYEADVLNLVPMLIAQRLLLHEEDRGVLNDFGHVLRSTALVAAKRWPESCFFQYLSIQSQTGTQYLECVDKHLDCVSCTPHLRIKLALEAAFNEFSMGIVLLCVDADATRLQSQLSGEEHMQAAVRRISVALGLSKSGSAEEEILTILSALATFMTKMPSLTSSEIHSLRKDILIAMNCLVEKEYAQHEPLVRAAAAFFVLIDAASKRWSSFLDAVQKAELTAPEKRHMGALIELLQLFDKDQHVVDEAQLPQSLLRAVGYRQQHRCTTCGRGSLGLRKCARCGKAKYCDKKCQQRHWKAGHKDECISPLISA
ncbi:hypothetical protein SISSUDRAFT_405564 [Sistotremastrum suecicum HHB10207 ss-3]|uniref:MYND-type domain-containing protein n=1 Tax=Sistotremastrum suecicum HHB10207 ss-3 TaxID=1314776 RepID=A0A165YRI7_9AGAM|nr:hypothetical protein SISSUDRAFT_405564 [Sistotremastrum suecicum HHB10207 ss-3]